MNLRYPLFLFAILSLFFSNNLYTQHLNFGLKSGINASYFHGRYIFTGGDVTLDLTPKLSTRFSGGGLVRYTFTPHFSLQSEFLYITKGVRFKQDVNIHNQDLNLTGNLILTYIEVPLLFRISTKRRERSKWFYPEPEITFNVYTGGSFSYKINSEFSGDVTGAPFGYEFDESFNNRVWNQFTDNDISFIAGVGFEYGVDTRFTMDFRYAISIMDIGNDPQFPQEIRNGMLSVLLGMVF
jgi:hypothetical protein